MRTRVRSGTAARGRFTRALGAVTAALALTGGVAGAGVANAQGNPYERGPDPTEDSIEDRRGPYSVDEENVSSLVPGFGGGTIYYPSRTTETFGGVAIAPGYTAGESSMSWYGPRLASQGFVVFTIDTNTRLDQPGSRGDQLLAALDYLAEDSDRDVQDRLDPDRLAVMGHSMGGGGSLEATADRPSLKASIPLTPWNLDKTWGEVTVPTFIIGAEDDTIASVSSHSEPFYESLSGSLDKAYLELAGASHLAPNSPDTTIAKYTLSWLKRFVDNDTRYTQFLCPGPDDGLFSDVEEYRSTCPF
ncbi:poly(ethylene terephthalate) hydrolase family protein [Saccharomonospora iraqiensis]|uniref:poly(ethylene terephthalate) hydrolase family protein n=1 Tax=Saccharomonospora iraqiensis TaxID=52698 RepID=UPI00022E0090|nr:lipase [Saccharomonospora iraqiensis]